MALAPGTRGHIRAIVAPQMLAQIGAFALPALLPDYIARWHLSKTEAGWRLRRSYFYGRRVRQKVCSWSHLLF
jgi:hypothetical protein